MPHMYHSGSCWMIMVRLAGHVGHFCLTFHHLLVSSPYNHFCARCRIPFLWLVLLLRCTPSFIETERPSPPITAQRSFLNQIVADKSWAVIGCFGKHFGRWRCFGDTRVSEEFRPPMLLSFIPKNDISFQVCQKILVYVAYIQCNWQIGEHELDVSEPLPWFCNPPLIWMVNFYLLPPELLYHQIVDDQLG